MICSNKDCSIEFEAKTHNQKYCSDECCRLATNKRIMEKYYEKKAIKNGASRPCKICNTQLSRYNDSKTCLACDKKISAENKKSVLRMINEVS